MRLKTGTKRLALVAGATLSLVAATVAAAQADRGAQPADNNLNTAKDKVELYRLFTGPDQRSHVETITLSPRKYNEGRTWIEASATRVTLGAMPNGLVGDYHPARRRTVLIPFQGTVIVDVGDGRTYRLDPGQMVLAEDRTGKGHISTCRAPAGTSQCLIMVINLKDDEEGLQAGFAAPPPPPNFSSPRSDQPTTPNKP